MHFVDAPGIRSRFETRVPSWAREFTPATRRTSMAGSAQQIKPGTSGTRTADAAASVAPVFQNVIEMIGNTPMLELKRIDTGPCRLFVKMESMNPGNSVKDRIAVYMIEQAERDGRLKPGGHIIEATA